MYKTLLQFAREGDKRSIARCISLIENNAADFSNLHLETTTTAPIPVLGITGPPGAGKSTLIDQLISAYVEDGKRLAVICVDPSSPFHKGAVLGDRIRMSRWYNHPAVYIRSLASRGALGGVPQVTGAIIDFISACAFDLIILETVGVGQSEISVSTLADLSIVVLVPEAGDEIQFMKAGLMEVADIFVVNKSDRIGADLFTSQLKDLLQMSGHSSHTEIPPVVNTVGTTGVGIPELKQTIDQLITNP
ncbi:MAG: methylmalonyl Co-A mutase-associated GTPase MeaB [bacterium]